MRNKCKIYYGLSGTFKATTITKNKKQDDPVLWSSIKLWKSFETGLFIGQVSDKNDINYAMLHLCNIDQLLKNINFKEDTTFYIERGITDMDFYHIKNATYKWWLDGEDWIRMSVEKELEFLKDLDIQKILLIQKDYDFIRDVILPEPTRRTEFTGPEDYLQRQDEYIDFTKKHNKIDQEIVITNAADYLKSLGIEYKDNINNN